MLPSVSPKVSIIVPAYNVTGYIADALESVFRQTFQDFEVIVVNDACPDTENLERALAPYLNRITYLRHKVNKGTAAARNTAIEACQAPLIALLDPDDIWEPDYLAVQTGLMDAQRDAAAIYPDATVFGGNQPPGRKFTEMFPSRGEPSLYNLIARHCYVFTGAIARRSAVEAVGMYDPELRLAQDFDLWLRLLYDGHKIVGHDRPLVRYRLRSGNATSDGLGMIQSVLKVYAKLLSLPRINEKERSTIEAWIGLYRAEEELLLGKRALRKGRLEEAVERLTRANARLRRRKLDLTIFGLRFTPRLVFMAMRRLRPDEWTLTFRPAVTEPSSVSRLSSAP